MEAGEEELGFLAEELAEWLADPRARKLPLAEQHRLTLRARENWDEHWTIAEEPR